MRSRLGVLGDLMAFFVGRRKFWLLPLVIALLVVGILIVFAATSVLAPLIYPLF
jgi:hypothetical protein